MRVSTIVTPLMAGVIALLGASGAAWADEDGSGGSKPSIAAADTSYEGATVLRHDIEVFGGLSAPGLYAGDGDETGDIDRYAYWQGDTLFMGATNPDTGNSVDAVVEVFWFESSIPKSADFYVVVVKVKSAPNSLTGWKLRQEEGWWTELWEGNKPCQMVDVNMIDDGVGGSIRWDWSVPFQNYGWEPIGSIEVAQSYSVGFDGDAEGSGDPLGKFKEGGFLKDISAGANIQAKGQFNKKFSVSSQYTVTLHKWQMLVQGGAGNMTWNMVVAEEGSVADDSAYHEYYIVVQAPIGQTVKIDSLDIGAAFHKPISFWFDGWDSLSSAAIDIVFTPPEGVECYLGSEPPAGACGEDSGCGDTSPVCVKGSWECPTPDNFEAVETSCDGFDNDCDGETDEGLTQPCETECGFGESTCFNGSWTSCDAPNPSAEICDGFDNDCDGEADNAAICDEPDPEPDPEPEPECTDSTPKPANFCGDAGVCADVEVECVNGEWFCAKPAAYEGIEESCDGLDNDCDGGTDEDLGGLCENECGAGLQECQNGAWTACSAPQPEPEICDGKDNDCNGIKDDGIDCGDKEGEGGIGDEGGDPGIDNPPLNDPINPDAGKDDNADSDEPEVTVVNRDTGCNQSGHGSSPAWLWALAGLFIVYRRRTSNR